MNCIVFENVSGLTNMPVAIWMVTEESMLDFSTNDDISITTSRNDTVAVETLTFNPLRASHGEGGEVYRCDGNLMSPAVTLDAETPGLIEVERQETLTVQSKLLDCLHAVVIHAHFHTVPFPTLSLNVTPHGPLLAGGAEDITLTCYALLDLTVVDTQQDILYSFTWRDRAGVEIVSGDRITISQSSSTTAFSSLTLSPLTTIDTNFTCAVGASVAQNVLLPSDLAMASISLDVGGEL